MHDVFHSVPSLLFFVLFNQMNEIRLKITIHFATFFSGEQNFGLFEGCIGFEPSLFFLR